MTKDVPLTDREITLLDEIDRLRSRYSTAVRDECDADTEIRNLARPVLGDAAVDGDSEHRPGMVDVVGAVIDRLREDVARLKAANEEWERKSIGASFQ